MPDPTGTEKELTEKIQEKANKYNENNVTRTMAYLDFHRRHPDIHWAFLAQMVSRNAGWNMTDLKGELLSKLLSSKQHEDFFDFLERGNWLIFQDAFPQLLLYEESIKRAQNLFYLLPYFNVSTFMETMWDHYWSNGDRELLATALIINEQNYIEKRLVQDPYYKKNVLYTLDFQLQDLLSLNQILMPSLNNKEDDIPMLFGETVHLFASLHERISLGKRLYDLLFGYKGKLDGVGSWANKQPHTGSRKDYFPQLFNNISESTPGVPHKKRTYRCRLRPGALRLYSPALHQVWDNKPHPQPEKGDWFDDWKVVYDLLNDAQTGNADIKKEYCKTLENIELVVMAKKAIFQRNGM